MFTILLQVQTFFQKNATLLWLLGNMYISYHVSLFVCLNTHIYKTKHMQFKAYNQAVQKYIVSNHKTHLPFLHQKSIFTSSSTSSSNFAQAIPRQFPHVGEKGKPCFLKLFEQQLLEQLQWITFMKYSGKGVGLLVHGS